MARKPKLMAVPPPEPEKHPVGQEGQGQRTGGFWGGSALCGPGWKKPRRRSPTA